MASDIFHKVSGFPGEDLAHQLDHQLIKLGTDFDRLGDAFSDLIADALKVSEKKHVANIKFTDAQIKHDIDAMGWDVIKLGDGFIKLDEAQHKFDDAFLNFADQFIKITPIETDQGGIKPGADFIKLETDLKLAGFDTIKLGLDFLKLNDTHTENPNQNFVALANDFDQIGKNLSSVGSDFGQIGSDFIKLGDIKLGDIKLGDIKFDQSDVLKLDAAFKTLGTDTIKIGTDFHNVSDDFQRIASDFTQSTDTNLTLKIDQLVLKFADDFHKLDTDMHTLDLDLKLMGDDTIKLAGLVPAIQAPGSPDDHGISDSLHQVLLLAHHFSLL